MRQVPAWIWRVSSESLIVFPTVSSFRRCPIISLFAPAPWLKRISGTAMPLYLAGPDRTALAVFWLIPI
jgi:hypothetical protein